MARGLRLAAFVLTAAAVWMAAPAADAAYMASYGNYDADPGEANHVTASFDGTFVTIADSVPITLEEQAAFPDAGNCSKPTPTSVRCSYPYGYRLGLGDGDDSFSFAGPAPPLPPTPDGSTTTLFDVGGGDGNDVLNGSPYGDALDGSYMRLTAQKVPGGVDRLIGAGGDDEISDSDGSANYLDGGPGDDHLNATPSQEAAKTAVGRNTLLGGPGKDYIEGGWGNDSISGGSGRDDLFGSVGRDKLRGGTGNDIVEGGPGRDVADGGPGNDGLSASFHGGCGGPDTFIGGSGRDSVYVFCGQPTLLLRDHTRDSASCSHPAKPKRIVADKKDRLKGRCARHRRRH